MALTRAQAFKVGFLLRCGDEGLTAEETAERVKLASITKDAAVWPWVATLGSKAMGTGYDLAAKAPAVALTAALGIPAVGGAAGGYALAKSTETGKDELEQAKQDEVQGEYTRLAEEARRKARRKKLEAHTGRRVAVLSPSL